MVDSIGIVSIHGTAARLDLLDQGTFERLASHVVRRRYPGLVGHGINAEGKTVNDPLDASFGGASAFYTTNKRLAQKWLSKGAKPGDLTVALARAATFRKRRPDQRPVVILATNRIVESGVQAKAQRRAEDAEVELIILEQSILADYLDTNPDGQFVRRLIFGVEQERLNSELLAEIASLMLTNYRQSAFIAEEPLFVPREVDGLLDSAATQSEQIRFVVGRSGCGKTQAVYSALCRHKERGGYALWIGPEFVRDQARLDLAIGAALRSHRPNLDAGCGQAAADLARATGKPLLLAIDDLNALSDPIPTAAKLASWNLTSADVTVIVPIWPNIWDVLPEPARKKASNRIALSAYRDSEAIDAVRRRFPQLDWASAREIASHCANDPLLIALLSAENAIEHARTGEIIREYIGQIVGELARCRSALAEDYTEVLLGLAGRVIETRTLVLSATAIQTEYRDGTAPGRRLRELLGDGRLISVNAGVLRFRHDRLRDTLVADFLTNNVTDATYDNFLDPFFSEAIGMALANAKSVSETLLARVVEHNPMALAYAVLNNGDYRSEDHPVGTTIRRLLVSQPLTLPLEYVAAMDWIFARITDSWVLSATQLYRDSFTLSRFVNGDPAAVVRFAYRLVDREYADTGEWVARALKANGAGLVGAVKAMLQGPDAVRRAALSIVPFLTSHVPANDALKAFESAADPNRLLAQALLAALRYPDFETSAALLDAVAALPDDTGQGLEPLAKGAVVDHIARHLQYTDGAYDTITGWAAGNDDRREIASGLLSRACSWRAIEYNLRVLAVTFDSLSPMGQAIRLDYYALSWEQHRGDDRLLLPVNIRDAIRALWSDTSEPLAIRRVAWRYWSKVQPDGDHGDAITHIAPTDPLYSEVLWFAVREGDARAVEPFLARLRDDNLVWMHLVEYLWQPDVRKEAFRLLGLCLAGSSSDAKAAEDAVDQFARTLRDIPPSDADDVFRRFGDELYNPDYILAGLYVGTPHAMRFAEEWLSDGDPEVLLIMLGSFFGFGDTFRSAKISAEMLRRIGPYLGAIEPFELEWLRKRALALGMRDWVAECVDPILPDYVRRQLVPNEGDLFRSLDSAAVGYPTEPLHWYESFARRDQSSAEAMPIAQRWFVARGTATAFGVYCALVRNYGSRADVAFLREHAHPEMGLNVLEVVRQIEMVVARRSLD